MNFPGIATVGPAAPADLGRSSAAPPQAPTGLFGRLVDQFLGPALAQQTAANEAVRDLALGRTEEVHTVLLAAAKADLSFRLLLEIRNRLTDAYQEVMRMSV